MNPRVFREYDIRGVAETDFTDDFVADLGRAIGAYFAETGARRVTLGRDCRLSSPRIHATFKRELLAAGIDVIDVGVLHSPGLYFSVFHLGTDGGVMITASHNPAEDNGFKIVSGKSTIHGAEIQKLREKIERRAFRTGVAPGKATEHDILADYVAYIADHIKLGPRRFKVVVDGGNGTGGIAILPDLEKAGRRRRGDLLRRRRALPQPPPRSDRPREPGGSHRARPSDGRRGGDRARRRRRSHRRGRRPGADPVGRSAGDPVRAERS